MSQAFDSAVPNRVLKDIVSEQPNRNNWSQELKDLLDPNLVARSIALPAVGAVINKRPGEIELYWCRLKLGANPDTSRFMQLKALGYLPATPEDAEVVNADIIEGKTEIRSGDRILVKVDPQIHRAIKKQYALDAIHQTNRAARGQFQDVQPGMRMSQQDRVMRTGDFAPTAAIDLNTGEREGNLDIATVMARSNPGNTSVAKRAGGK